jgi:adenosylmethionine-8-amino-7-oxononanoate aminotransferase
MQERSRNRDIARRDLGVVWHPCTQMKDHESLPLVPIERGEGAWLYDFDGRRYLDAISSWWVNLFGHANPRINAAVRHQLDRLEHVILAGFTHEPVLRLSERLTGLLPAGLTRCVYWLNQGKPGKKRFITLGNSYHGETLGALAVGDVELYKSLYRPLLMDVTTVASPDCYLRDPDETWEQHSRRMFAHMERALAEHAHETAAVIVEPLVQCAGGMRMYHPAYLQMLREACDRHGVHLIADEIAVGFGRTGTLFACEQAGIRPDIICLSKGLTGGYLPLSVVVTTEDTYGAFYDDYTKLTAFLHSHSYTGNPLACAAALATLDIFESDRVIEKNRRLAGRMAAAAGGLADHPNVAEVRQTGMILAIELVRDREGRVPFDWRERRGLRLYEYALSRGVLLRPLGHVVYWMPPYVLDDEQLALLADVTARGIDIACA